MQEILNAAEEQLLFNPIEVIIVRVCLLCMVIPPIIAAISFVLNIVFDIREEKKTIQKKSIQPSDICSKVCSFSLKAWIPMAVVGAIVALYFSFFGSAIYNSAPMCEDVLEEVSSAYNLTVFDESEDAEYDGDGHITGWYLSYENLYAQLYAGRDGEEPSSWRPLKAKSVVNSDANVYLVKRDGIWYLCKYENNEYIALSKDNAPEELWND